MAFPIMGVSCCFSALRPAMPPEPNEWKVEKSAGERETLQSGLDSL